MRNIILLSIVLLFINSVEAQSLSKGFRLINKGKFAEAKAFFQKNNTLCLAKAGLLEISILNNELTTIAQLNNAYAMAKELTECYETLSPAEIEKYKDYITKNDIADIWNVIEEKFYVFSKHEDKIENYKLYLENYADGKYATQANDAIEFLNAKSINSKESYKYFLENHTNGEYKNEIVNLIAKLYFEETQTIHTEKELLIYLSAYPYGYYKEEVFTSLDRIYFESARSFNTLWALQNYLDIYPHGNYKDVTIGLIEKLHYTKAEKENTVEAYNAYLNKYPDGFYSKTALAGIETIKGKAGVKLVYPKSVKAGRRYEWTTNFFETGGYVGYKLKAVDFYIQAPNGSKFSNNWSNTVEVKPGGTDTVSYWCDESTKWNGGFFHCVWEGIDDKGNSISIVQDVRLIK